MRRRMHFEIYMYAWFSRWWKKYGFWLLGFFLGIVAFHLILWGISIAVMEKTYQHVKPHPNNTMTTTTTTTASAE